MASEETLKFRLRSIVRAFSRVPFVSYLLLGVVYYSAFHDSPLIYQVEASETCPDFKAKNITWATKAWSKPCTAHFSYCAPSLTEPVPASCPGKLVYSPQRGRCDLRKTCKELGQKTDLECMDKPCGLYGAIDCKKYFICSGGTKIWKECPGDTVFDFELEICKIEGKCKYPVEPIVPTDLPPDDETDPLEDSERSECQFHDHSEPEDYTQDDKEPSGIILESTKITDWGKWQPWSKCPDGMYITGLSTWRRTVEDPSGKQDHAGIISIGFKCENVLAKKKADKVIGQVAKNAPDSVWDFFLSCERGAAVGFQLSQLEDQGLEDDVATDNLKLICSCGVNTEIFKPYHEPLEKYLKTGGQMGEWTEKKFCKEKQALCAFRTQMQDWTKSQVVNLEKDDQTGLNNIMFKCCDVQTPAKKCEAKTIKKYLQTCDNLDGYVKRPCPFNTYVGAMYSSQNMTRATSFYTSLGFTMDDGFADLEKNLKSNLPACGGKSKICQQQWIHGENQDSRRMFQLAHKESSEVNITAGVSIKLFQLVVQCGIYEVFTNQIMLEAKEAKEGKEKPPPETHLFEGSITFVARRRKKRSVLSSYKSYASTINKK